MDASAFLDDRFWSWPPAAILSGYSRQHDKAHLEFLAFYDEHVYGTHIHTIRRGSHGANTRVLLRNASPSPSQHRVQYFHRQKLGEATGHKKWTRRGI